MKATIPARVNEYERNGCGQFATALEDNQLRKGQASEYEFREIGESEWTPCDKDWFDYCQKSPEHDARLSKEQE